MQLDVRLELPRQARSVPVAREVAGSLLAGADAPADAIDDVTLALGEACANAVLHAAGVDSYSVRVAVDGRGCAIDVEDLGPSVPSVADRNGSVAGEDSVGRDEVAAETGRGLEIMRALVDDLRLERAERAMRVHLVKRWDHVAAPPDPPEPPADAGPWSSVPGVCAG